MAKAKTRKLRFLVNTHYEGNLVGPGTENEVVEVTEEWAKTFIENNAAVEVVVIRKRSQPGKSGELPEVVETQS